MDKIIGITGLKEFLDKCKALFVSKNGDSNISGNITATTISFMSGSTAYDIAQTIKDNEKVNAAGLADLDARLTELENRISALESK